MKSLPVLVALAALSVSPAWSVVKHKKAKSGKKPVTHAASHAAKGKKATKAAGKTRPRPWSKAVVVSPRLRQESLEQISARMTPAAGQIENAETLATFFARLSSTRTGGQPVHILQFGDSHTASDDWVDSMRHFLQARYGDGGPGFGMAGRPFKGYRRFDLKGNNSPGWETEGRVSHPGDGLTGLSGVSLTSHAAGETVWADTSADEVQLYYLKQPGGGAFAVELDGAPVETVNTDGELSTGVYAFPAGRAEHIFAVRTVNSAPVRLYGWVAQNHAGVTWETLGINGSQAGMMLHWDEAIWGQQMARRNPALVVLAYGTNEANSRTFDPGVFRSGLRDLFARIRRAVPDAAILLVGPPDCGRLGPLLHLDEVVTVERVAAGENRVAFWDWRQRMGGARSVSSWVRAGLGQADYIHMTGAGYRLVGQDLAGELEEELRRYSPAAQESQ